MPPPTDFFTTKPLGSGTGLGLSMVKDFARQASGTALIDSVMGEGTSVSLLLPIYRDPAPAAVAAPVDESAGEPASQRGCAMVIEDEVAIRELVAESLKELGFEVIEVTAPAEALQHIDQRPDLQLVVTDLVLPGSLAGDRIAEGARARVPGLRVLFISGLIDGDAELAERQDRTRLLPKPFTLQQFKACVEGMFTEANTTTQP